MTHYDIPVHTKSSDKRSLNTALHLIVVFTLLMTGVFLLLYRTVRESLPPEESNNMAMLPLSGWQGWLMMILAGILLIFILRSNKAAMRPAVSNLLKGAEFLTFAGFGIFCFVHQMTMPGILYLLVCGLVVYSFFQQTAAQQNPEVFVDEAGVSVPTGGMRKSLAWKEVSTVLIKHGVLTVDCLDNRLYQWNIVKTTNLNLDGFEEFCSRWIEKAKPDRNKNDW